MTRIPHRFARPVLAGLTALLAVAFVNGLAYQLERRASPALRSALRIDLTQSARLSLSPQTQAALDRMTQPARIVLIERADETDPLAQTLTESLSDLAREYAERSTQIEVQRLTLDDASIAGLQRDIAVRYPEAVAASTAEAQPIFASLRDIAQRFQSAADAVSQAADALPAQADGLGPANDLRLCAGRLSAAGQEAAALAEQGAARLEASLPDLAPWSEAVREAGPRWFAQAVVGEIRQLNRLQRAAEADPTAQDAWLRAGEQLNQSVEPVRQLVVNAQSLTPDAQLTGVLRGLQDAPRAVVLGPSGAVVLGQAALVRPGAPQAPGQDESSGALEAFIGEEALTGALLRVNQSQPLLVVLLLSDTGPALGGPNSAGAGLFHYAAERLARLGADVRQWQPPSTAQGSAPTSPSPPRLDDLPQPGPGQPAVYVALPFSAPRSGAVSPERIARERAVAAALVQQLDRGHGGVVLLNFDPTQPTSADPRPIAQALRDRGINPVLDRRAAQLVDQPGGGQVITGVFETTLAPDASSHPVAAAVQGLPLRFELPTAIELGPASTAQPVVALRQRRQWTYAVPPGGADGRVQTADASDYREQIVVAAATETQDGARLLVVSEPTWASDPVAAAGVDDANQSASARRQGARLRYPGNGELWVNAVLWSAGLDDLVAATPRSRDVPRIGPLDPARRQAVRAALLFGVPAGVLLLGSIIGWRRRA